MHELNRLTMNSDHLLSRLDPRVKLVFTLVLLAMVISCKGFVFPLLVGGLSLGFSLHVGVRLKVLLGRFAEPFFIAVMVIILKLFFSGAVPLFSIHFKGIEVVGHRDGLLEGLFIASRILGSVSLTALLVFSTTFTDLMAALAWLKVPRGFIEVALFAWRYLFTLFDDAQVVYAAQKNRLGYAGLLRGMRSFGALVGALVIKAFDSSQSVTCAMMQRGYDGTIPLSRHSPLNFMEVALSLTFLLAMGIIWRI
jgi:cobalt/nickel transport system permease protein